MNTMNFRNIKKRIRGLLLEKIGFFAGITLLFSVAAYFLSSISDSVVPHVNGFLDFILYVGSSLIGSIITSLLFAGIIGIYLDFCREREPSLSGLFSAFSVHPEAVAVYAVIVFVLREVVADGGLYLVSKIRTAPDQTTLLIYCAILIIGVILVLRIALSLCLYYFVYNDDPNQPASVLIRRTLQLTNGRRMKLLYLYLSFSGLLLLSLLSLGTGLLFVKPYMYATMAQFYLNLCSQTDRSAESNE